MSHHPARWYVLTIYVFFSLVILSSFWIIFRANGYRLMTSPIRIVKTSVISVDVHPKIGADIYINNNLQRVGLADFIDLAPGRYALRVEKGGYKSWETTVDLPAGQAVRFASLTLLYSEPKLLTLTPTEEQAAQSALDQIDRFQRGLQVFEGELWASDELVTRYSQPIKQAVWLPDEQHLLVLERTTLHYFDLESRQDTVLLTLPIANDVRFVPMAGGQKIALDLDGILSVYEITDPYSIVPLPSFN